MTVTRSKPIPTTSYEETTGNDLLTYLYNHPEVPVAVDTETTGLRITDGDYCIGVSIAFVGSFGGHSHYFGIAHPSGVNVSRETLDKLMWVLHQPRLLIFANVQFDILSLDTIEGGYESFDDADFIDVCVMAHLIDENTPKVKRLEDIGQHYLDVGKIVDPYVEAEKKSGNQTITPEVMWAYACQDAALTWRLWDHIKDLAAWAALPSDLWKEKQKLIRVLLAMRRRKVRIDQALARQYVTKGEAELKRLAIELGYPAKPTRSNPDPLPVLGSKALTDIFLVRLGLPVVKRSAKTKAPSFDKEVMEVYDLMLEEDDRPEAKLVKEYRGWQKAVGASYRPYLALVEADGRLGCSYNVCGTVTGRMSCSEPNLQQIPKESDKPWNGKVKECFIAEEGYTLINADFSQLELRLATAYADEKGLKAIFAAGRDIFTEMAAQLGMVRHKTKTLVYSMQYGAGVKRIMAAFGVSKQEAIAIRNNYFATYPRFKMLGDLIAARAEKEGKVRIWTGRYRHLQYKSQAYKAMNSVIQGGAADIVERCMVRCFELLDSDDCRMLLQVHDSITFEVRNELVPEMMRRIKEVMEDVEGYVGHNDFDVTFAVEVDFWSPREKQSYEEWELAA